MPGGSEPRLLRHVFDPVRSLARATRGRRRLGARAGAGHAGPGRRLFRRGQRLDANRRAAAGRRAGPAASAHCGGMPMRDRNLGVGCGHVAEVSRRERGVPARVRPVLPIPSSASFIPLSVRTLSSLMCEFAQPPPRATSASQSRASTPLRLAELPLNASKKLGRLLACFCRHGDQSLPVGVDRRPQPRQRRPDQPRAPAGG
eukprot:scaffold14829_cov115-Isochrysis_galbana.AAC.3